MLTELLGHSLTATELAARADVTPATASVHLAKLVAGGLLVVEPQGRHRYFRLAGRRVARALESLAAVTPRAHVAARPPDPLLEGLRFARTCYDHLAGWLGVTLNVALVERGLLTPDGSELRVTKAGEAWLRAFGIDVAATRRTRRSFARACLDWSERRHQIAGALGQVLLAHLMERRWLSARSGDLTVDLTAAGRRGLARELGLSLPG